MRSYGTPKRWWASISSSPLFIRVAESMVIFPPMSQVGWASASSRGHRVEVGAAAERAAAGGEHEPVHRAGPLAGDQLEQRGVLGVHRQQLRARGLGQRRHELAAHHEALLVGQREVDALAQRRDRGAEAGRAHQGVQHEVAVGVGDQLDEALGAPPAPPPASAPTPAPRRPGPRARRGSRHAQPPARAAAPSSRPRRGPPPPAPHCARPRRAPACRWSRSSRR